MNPHETIISFDHVSFEYVHNKPLLNEASFSVRKGMKVTVMGQNGAGKSTIFKLIAGTLKAQAGSVNVVPRLTIATAHQVMHAADKKLSVEQFFQNCFKEKMYDIGRRIDEILEVVNLHAPHDKIIQSFSGGQQARLLLAAALIQDPDLLLLDEPTNNLDKAGIEHLTDFLIHYEKTCMVISHDEDFLNAFTEGVLYLDSHTHKVEQYGGNYFNVVAEIEARIEKENRKNAQLAKGIQENKEKANFFAHKGGKLRLVAKRMREKIEEFEENKVEVRREDKPIRNFVIPAQENLGGEIVKISTIMAIKDHKPQIKKVKVVVRKNQHLLLSGPNGIGKSTLLETLARAANEGNAVDLLPNDHIPKEATKGIVVDADVRVGYYRQDFSTLNFDDTVYQSLQKAMKLSGDGIDEQRLRSVGAGFLITKENIYSKIGTLSEGQKGLVAFASLVLLKPGLLILDEPTNHINFRHLPIIASALNSYEGAMILVSHVPEFVTQIRIDEILDLNKP